MNIKKCPYKNCLKKYWQSILSWVSSVFKIIEESIICTFKKETNTFINSMEKLLVEDENLIEELEHDYEWNKWA